MNWGETANGGFFTQITDKARKFAGESDDRLAAVALAAWLRDFGVQFDWNIEKLRFAVNHTAYQDIEAKATRLTDSSLVAIDHPEASYSFAVRLTPNSDIACVHGLTYRSHWGELRELHPEGVPVTQLCRAADWLRLFSIHHHPCAEVLEWQKSQTACGGKLKKGARR